MEKQQFPVHPLADKIIVETVMSPSVTRGRLFIPETAKEKPAFARVRAVGVDVKRPLVVDAVILHGKYSGTSIQVEGRDYLIMREEEVLAVVVDPVMANQLVFGSESKAA